MEKKSAKEYKFVKYVCGMFMQVPNDDLFDILLNSHIEIGHGVLY